MKNILLSVALVAILAGCSKPPSIDVQYICKELGGSYLDWVSGEREYRCRDINGIEKGKIAPWAVVVKVNKDNT